MTELEIQRAKEKIARTLWGDTINIQLPLEKTTHYVTSFSLISYDKTTNEYNIDSKNNHNLSNIDFKLSIYDFDIETIAKYNIKFVNCSFECEVNLNPSNKSKKDKLFEYKNTLAFDNVTFKKNFDCSFIKTNGKIMFDKVIFNEVSFENSIFNKKANFSCAKFVGKSCFAKAEFDEEANFSNAKFYDNADFSGAIFRADAYFHRAVFKQDLQMYRTAFERVANFYFATFESVVNFSACVIQNPRFLNFVGVDTKRITLNQMAEYINKKVEYEARDNKEKDKTKIHLKIQRAQNLKDSFRAIKDTLLSQNNLLEAQNWHILELYAKELELEFSIEQEQHKKVDTTQKCDKDNKQDSKKSKNNELDFTLWIDNAILKLYRHTSNHHTNFTTILNFTTTMIVSYGSLLFLMRVILPYMMSYGETISYSVTLIIGLFFLAIFHSFNKNAFGKKLTLLFILFMLAYFLLSSTFLIYFVYTLCFLMIYVIVLGIFYSLFRTKNIADYFRAFMYFFLLWILVAKPQLLNPLVGIFSADILSENRLEKRLNNMEANAIINLSKISQKEFNLRNDDNASFRESKSVKEIILSNKNELSNIISFLFDNRKVDNFKTILATLKDNPNNLSNTIKNIDDSNSNSVIFCDMKKLLKYDFDRDDYDISCSARREFTSISMNPSHKEYQIFESQENQTRLKNILTLIDLNDELKLKEIKEIIDYDEASNSIIKSTSIIYGIILLLCLFSLQKSARKNSIIPA